MVKEKTVHTKQALARKDADVVKKGSGPAVPQEPWVQDVGPSVFATGYGNDPAGAFLARPAKNRATPHKKVNEYDY